MLLDLKPADILDYYNSLYAKGLTGNTVLHYHVLLRKALKEASMRGFIQNDPTDFIPRPKKEQSAADCYSPEECRKLLNALHDDPLELPITLAVLYGLRRSEVLGPRWGAIDYERATITISHSVTSTAVNGKRQLIAKDKLKRKSSFRTLPLMPQVAAMLQNAAIQRYGTQPPPKETEITATSGEMKTGIYDGYSPEIEPPLMAFLKMLSADSNGALIVDSLKSVTRNITKLLSILEFLLTRDLIFASTNYYMENGHVERRMKPLRAGHSTNDMLRNVSNTSGLGYKHKAALSQYAKQAKSTE